MLESGFQSSATFALVRAATMLLAQAGDGSCLAGQHRAEQSHRHQQPVIQHVGAGGDGRDSQDSPEGTAGQSGDGSNPAALLSPTPLRVALPADQRRLIAKRPNPSRSTWYAARSAGRA
jgi:hypothetical protein